MKIPAIRKLPSGAWFCQLRIDGKSISITDMDYDTVQAKAYAYKAGLLKDKRAPKQITVGQALEEYIESRGNVISPSTLRGYKMISKHRFLGLQKRAVTSLTQSIVQRAINEEAALCAPKTLKNAWMLIASAIVQSGGESYSVKLPMVQKHDKAFLQPEQIPVFCEAIKGSVVEVPALLALWSCRRSEILGLDWSNVDLEQRRIKICESVVIGDAEKKVCKPTLKTSASVRTIPICQQLYDALSAVPPEQRCGKVVDLPHESMYKRINTICRRSGLPLVGVHGLRHSFASLSYSLGISAKAAMRIGGWSNDSVMLSIYTHLADADVSAAENALTEFFAADQNANKNANG